MTKAVKAPSAPRKRKRPKTHWGWVLLVGAAVFGALPLLGAGPWLLHHIPGR